MASRYKDKDLSGGVVFSFNGSLVSWSHTVIAYSMRPSFSLFCFKWQYLLCYLTISVALLTCEAAFISALVLGISLHYHKIVQNQWYGYPDEWFPSVSSTIGDRYPERSFFQLFIAMTSGALPPNSSFPFSPSPP
jgi:hypothetical protein